MSRKMTTFQKILLHLLLIICVGMTIMPVVLVFFSSLKESSTLISTSLIPKFSELSLVNYKRLLTETPFLRWVWNTVVVSALSSVIAIIVTALAGYAFSRFKFFGRKNGLMAMILLQMFPAAMAMVAIFSMLQHLGDLTGGLIGLDSLLGLSLVYIGAGIPSILG